MRLTAFRDIARILLLVGLWASLWILWKRHSSTSGEKSRVSQEDLCPECQWLLPEDDPNGFFGDRILQQLAYIPKDKREEPVTIYEFSEPSIQPFHRKVQSPVISGCFLTNKREHLRTASALLFTPFFLDQVPLEKATNQVWVLQLLESPNNTQTLVDFNGKINFTSSYRWDSDIVTPYGKWFRSKDRLKDPHNFHRVNETDSYWGPYLTPIFNKGSYVDVFGECGVGPRSKQERDDMLRADYKFYLAFENSNCRDYVTEKLFENALNNSVIPVVMGAPRKDYEKIAPPHSFIHVNDFPGPSALAKFLIYLSTHPAEYNSYFGWRGRGRFIRTNFYSRLCTLIASGRHKSYEDVENWWQSDGVCGRPASPKRSKDPGKYFSFN